LQVLFESVGMALNRWVLIGGCLWVSLWLARWSRSEK